MPIPESAGLAPWWFVFWMIVGVITFVIMVVWWTRTARNHDREQEKELEAHEDRSTGGEHGGTA